MEPVSEYKYVDLNLGEESRVIVQSDKTSLASEQYRTLRRKLKAKHPAGATVMITSPGPGDGKTLTAVNLAFAFASYGMPALLLELDVRRPAIGQVLGLKEQQVGVEEAIKGRVAFQSAVRVDRRSGLAMLLAGKPAAMAPSIVIADRIRMLLDWARSRFNWVIVDAPPVFPAADVGELAPVVDAAVMVLRARVTKKDLVVRAAETLGDKLCGVVLNEADSMSDSSYRYITNYYSNYES